MVALSALNVSEVAPAQSTVAPVVSVASEEAVRAVVPERVVVVLVRVVVAPSEILVVLAESVISLPCTLISPFTSRT